MIWDNVAAEDIAYAAAGLVLTAFSVWLLALSPRQRATRALAVLLVAMSVAWSADLLWVLAPGAVGALRFVSPAAMSAIGLSTIYFLSVHPRPRGWLGRSRWGGWTMLAIGAALAVVFFIEPDLFSQVALVDGSWTFIDNGPLVLLMNAWTLTAVAMLYVFALDLRTAPAGPVRRSLVLVFAGFLTSMLSWTGALFFNDTSRRLDPASISASFGRVTYILEEASFLAAVGAAALVIAYSWRSTDASIRREGYWLSALTGGTVGIVAVVSFLGGAPGPQEWISPSQSIVDALGGMTIAALAGYALLKHRLFDIDVKLRWTISRGTVAAIFLAIFFIAAQLAQNFLSESYGWMLGGVIAGVMLFAIAPIQRVAERVAIVAVPVHTTDPRERRVELYRLSLALALCDRTITRDEERHLAKLAEELGLSHSEALAARDAMERELGIVG